MVQESIYEVRILPMGTKNAPKGNFQLTLCLLNDMIYDIISFYVALCIGHQCSRCRFT